MVFRFRSIVDAGRGRTERGRDTVLPLIEDAARSGRAHWEALMQSTLAFVEFAAGEHRAVDRALTRMHECMATVGARDFVPDRSEPFTSSRSSRSASSSERGRLRSVSSRAGARFRVSGST